MADPGHDRSAGGGDRRPQIWLIRHGQTEWSRLGRHTSRTDVGLTAAGQAEARDVGRRLQGLPFARVRTSPARRAIETATLAGFQARAEPTPDLAEWDYGRYEGLTTAEIRREIPGWTIWDGGAPGGEPPAAVGRRVDRVIAEAAAAAGDSLLIAHAHVLRVLAARWLRLEPGDGRLFVLATGTVSVLGWEREQAAIVRWNERCDPESREPAPQRTTSTEQAAP